MVEDGLPHALPQPRGVAPLLACHLRAKVGLYRGPELSLARLAVDLPLLQVGEVPGHLCPELRGDRGLRGEPARLDDRDGRDVPGVLVVGAPLSYEGLDCLVEARDDLDRLEVEPEPAADAGLAGRRGGLREDLCPCHRQEEVRALRAHAGHGGQAAGAQAQLGPHVDPPLGLELASVPLGDGPGGRAVRRHHGVLVLVGELGVRPHNGCCPEEAQRLLGPPPFELLLWHLGSEEGGLAPLDVVPDARHLQDPREPVLGKVRPVPLDAREPREPHKGAADRVHGELVVPGPPGRRGVQAWGWRDLL